MASEAFFLVNIGFKLQVPLLCGNFFQDKVVTLICMILNRLKT